MPTKKATTQKKGSASWKPASILETKRLPGYRVRYVLNDAAEIEKKQREQWVFASELEGTPVQQVNNHAHVADHRGLTSLQEYREMILMAIPEETAKLRETYYNEVTDNQTVGPITRAKAAIRDGEMGKTDSDDVLYKPEL